MNKQKRCVAFLLAAISLFLPSSLVCSARGETDIAPCFQTIAGEEKTISEKNVSVSPPGVYTYLDNAVLPTDKTAGKREVLLGGMNFGVRISSDGVLVVGLGDNDGKAMKDSPAYKAGIRTKDIIIAINGKKVMTTEDVAAAIHAAGKQPLVILCRRMGNEKEFTVQPETDKNGEPRIGVWLRDSSAGIGTVTFIDPQNGAFGGLGHGICDMDTGNLIPLRRGEVRDAVITGLTRGETGKPGEMRGYLGKNKCGSLIANTGAGVFGVYTQIPSGGVMIPVASPEEVTVGDATLYTTLDCGEIRPYSIRITGIDRAGAETKSFTLEVTDKTLLQKSGGIIQGMSGSPIVQNGKLVGAVTHVLISDPKNGYGIFLNNMINAMPELLRP